MCLSVSKCVVCVLYGHASTRVVSRDILDKGIKGDISLSHTSE